CDPWRYGRAARRAARCAFRRWTGSVVGPFGGRARRAWRFFKAEGWGTRQDRRALNGAQHAADTSTRSNTMSAIVSLRDVVKTYTRGKQSVEVLHRLNLSV